MISELPLAIKLVVRNYPIRIRVISGLSQGVVDSEASMKNSAHKLLYLLCSKTEGFSPFRVVLIRNQAQEVISFFQVACKTD